jgi:hypothetical protein
MVFLRRFHEINIESVTPNAIHAMVYDVSRAEPVSVPVFSTQVCARASVYYRRGCFVSKLLQLPSHSMTLLPSRHMRRHAAID